MATDEEYLDNLLKSLADSEQQPRTMEEALKELVIEPESPAEDGFPMSSDELANMLEGIDIPEETNEPEIADIPEETNEPEIADIPEETSEPEISDILEETAAPEVEAESDEMDLEGAEDILQLLEQSEETVMDESDITQIIDEMDNIDDDLAEINGLLKKVDKNESVEEDMLALLESVKENQPEDNQSGDDDNFDIFAQADQLDETENEPAKDADNKKKRKTGKSKKQKGTEEETDADVQPEEEIKNKKPGIFSKFITFMTKEDDEPEDGWDDNEQIMKELDEEDKQNAKKKGKKKKKKEQLQEQTENAENAAEGEAEETDNKKKKSKKEKPPKEKKEKKEKQPKVKEKQVKVLSRRTFLLMVALCATLVASIFALSTFLSEYADKQNARNAFWQGEYDTVYVLMYDKQLSESDALIFNKAKTVLKLERKWESYENNIALGKELEALDILLQGVDCYMLLVETDEYGVKEELDVIYERISEALMSNYEISRDYAITINALDNATYTRKLNSVVDGTEFYLPGEEPQLEEPLSPQDILPEEEEIITF